MKIDQEFVKMMKNNVEIGLKELLNYGIKNKRLSIVDIINYDDLENKDSMEQWDSLKEIIYSRSGVYIQSIKDDIHARAIEVISAMIWFSRNNKLEKFLDNKNLKDKGVTKKSFIEMLSVDIPLGVIALDMDGALGIRDPKSASNFERDSRFVIDGVYFKEVNKRVLNN